mmetsp:Transcript_12369/g.43313  ORF Transcript_12369/g.43313 Transcript_12369/m.43313 type:complete len:351 (-) Transcript_12369:3-1055(-)
MPRPLNLQQRRWQRARVDRMMPATPSVALLPLRDREEHLLQARLPQRPRLDGRRSLLRAHRAEQPRHHHVGLGHHEDHGAHVVLLEPRRRQHGPHERADALVRGGVGARQRRVVADVDLETAAVLAFQVQCCAEALEAAQRHDRDALAQRLRLVHRVSRQHHAAPHARALDEAPHRPARLGVEPGRRLVEEEHARVADERHAEREPPLHAAAQRRGVGVGPPAVEADGVQRTLQHLRLALRRQPLDAGVEGEVLAHRHARVEHVELRAHADDLVHVGHARGDVEARDACAAARRREQPSEYRDRRRLAGAVRAQQAQHLVVPHAQAEVVEGRLVPVRLPQVERFDRKSVV